MTLSYCTTDQVQVLSICVSFCRSFAPFVTQNIGKTQFSAFFSYMLWHIKLKFCILYFWLIIGFILLYFRSSLSVVNFCKSYAPFWTYNAWDTQIFRTILLYALTYWAEILHMTSFYCTTDQVQVLSICANFCRVTSLLDPRILKIQGIFFTLFSYMLWHIDLKFCICANNLHQFL